MAHRIIEVDTVDILEDVSVDQLNSQFEFWTECLEGWYEKASEGEDPSIDYAIIGDFINFFSNAKAVE